jgi:hypothetical protein
VRRTFDFRDPDARHACSPARRAPGPARYPSHILSDYDVIVVRATHGNYPCMRATPNMNISDGVACAHHRLSSFIDCTHTVCIFRLHTNTASVCRPSPAGALKSRRLLRWWLVRAATVRPAVWRHRALLENLHSWYMIMRAIVSYTAQTGVARPRTYSWR